MRAAALLFVLGLVACSDEPSVRIIVPLPDTTVVASVELRMEGHQLTNTTETKVYVDLQHYTGDLIQNTLPEECESCRFVISFGGASISNGPHTIGVYFFDGETQLATDAVPVVFAR